MLRNVLGSISVVRDCSSNKNRVVFIVVVSSLTPGSLWPSNVEWSRAGQCFSCLAGGSGWGVIGLYGSSFPIESSEPTTSQCVLGELEYPRDMWFLPDLHSLI